MTGAGRFGVLGGTLDPIHMGHVEAALVAREALALDRVLVIPAHVPPHRTTPASSPFHRFAMAALAVNGVEGLAASDMEVLEPGPSYTADTLLRLHAQGYAASQIFFITGADAFAEIETWNRYPAVLDLANFVVVSRPGMPLTMLRQRLPELKPRMRLPIGAARGHREAPPTATETSIFLVDAPTPDVSSTDIRRRVADGLSIAGLVPPAVQVHIHQHALYSQSETHPAPVDQLHGQD
jgi:nicotinate-nucleotide adenylyltransferase